MIFVGIRHGCRYSDYMNQNRWLIYGVSALVFVFGVGSWFYVERVSDSIETELSRLVPRVQGPNFDSAEQLLFDLRQIDIQKDTTPDASYLITRLLTIQRPPSSRKQPVPPPGPAWTSYVQTAPFPARVRMSLWETMTAWSGITKYILQLYEENFGSTRNTVHYLASYKTFLPSFNLLFAQALREKMKIQPTFHYGELSPEMKEGIHNLLADDTFLNWAQSKAVNLRELAGNTSTVLGLYDWISYPEFADKVGFKDISKNADVYYDLGGGFATPDISRLFGKSFTSLDVIRPPEVKKWKPLIGLAESWMLPELNVETARSLTVEEYKRYAAVLDKTPWKHYNIFKDALPADHQSYVFTSFSFLGSAVGTSVNSAPYMQRYQYNRVFATTYVGVRRIVDLIAQGKKVDLFVYLRSEYRADQYRTVFLSFNDHHLLISKLLPVGLLGKEKQLKRTGQISELK